METRDLYHQQIQQTQQAQHQLQQSQDKLQININKVIFSKQSMLNKDIDHLEQYSSQQDWVVGREKLTMTEES